MLIIALIEKYTVQAVLCWSIFIVYCVKATSLQQNQTYLDNLALVKRKKN